jgi:hypothetical protein
MVGCNSIKTHKNLCLASCIVQESKVIHTSKWRLTQDLHIIRAHQLYYTSLLDDFQKSVEFVAKAENPAMNSDSVPENERELNKHFIKRECENLLLEIKRLEKDLVMQEKRLRNVMNLVRRRLG